MVEIFGIENKLEIFNLNKKLMKNEGKFNSLQKLLDGVCLRILLC
jgi:hypothetical protein